MPNDKTCQEWDKYLILVEDLKNASPEDLLGAYLMHLGKHTSVSEEFKLGVVAGFMLGQANGWKHIAPQWIVDYRDKQKSFGDASCG